MSEQIVNIGITPNDGNGDSLREAFRKLKENDHELYQLVLTELQKAALAGTNGTPSGTNKFVTDSDGRLTDARPTTGGAGGDLTGTYPDPTVAENKIGNTKLSDVPQNTVKGRVSLGSGDPEDLTPAQARLVMNVPAVEDVPVNFEDLDDVPDYTGNALRFPRVNSTEDGIEFVSPGAVYTDENAQDAVGSILFDDGDVDFNYNDTTPSITANVKNNTVSNAKLGDMAAETIKGRMLPDSGDPQDLTPEQAREVMDVYSKDEVDLMIGSGGGSGEIYSGPVANRQFGGITLPFDPNGKTAMELLKLALVAYDTPYYSAGLGITGVSNIVEVGTTLSGLKTFTYATAFGSNITNPTTYIRDVTNAIDLVGPVANSGSTNANIGSVVKSSQASHAWSVRATNSQGGAVGPSNFTVSWLYKLFFGATASSPASSADVRGLSQSAFRNGTGVVILNTGNTLTKFVFAAPVGVTISVVDLDALNANITSQYVSTGTISVDDAGSAPVSYTVYEMNNAVAYSSNHRHQVTHN